MIDLARLFDLRTRALLLGGAALLGAPQVAAAAGFEMVDEPVAAAAPQTPPHNPPPLSAGPASIAAVSAEQVARPAQALAAEPIATQPVVDDGLGKDGFYLEADLITADNAAKSVTAEGNVEVRYRGRILRAQTLTYRQATGVVEASGEVQILNPDGTAQFAKQAVLDEDLTTGVALGFSARLQNNVKIAAASAIRRSETVNELNRAIYTPCNTCAADGRDKTPTWSVSASQVVQDSKKRTVYYRNAVIRIGGVPVAYAPVFWHADPNAGAQSGLLTPRFSASSKRGLSLETPYYWSISPSQDLVLAPMINGKVNPMLNGEWRKLFAKGEVGARFGYTYETEFDNSGDPIPGSPATSRSYILAAGQYRFTPEWTAGFSAERASDALLFDRYDIPDVYEKRGLFETDTRRLLSQVYAVRQVQASYLSISALNFQGLQIGDRNGAFPVVAPLVEGRWAPQTEILGGRLQLAGSAVVLTRQDSPTVVNAPGIDSRRATVGGDWRANFTLPAGVRVSPFATARFDGYNVDGLAPGVGDETSWRSLGTVGVDVSWPFIRQSASSTVILEPILQAALSPEPDFDPFIPNQDTAAVVFDETNLFDPNRAPGFDIYDGGARLNAGARATVYWGDNRRAQLLVGKSFRDERNVLIPVSGGYRDTESDWIVAASTTPIRGLSLYGRTRLDPDDLEVKRAEAGASFALPWAEGYARYLNDRSDPLAPRLETAEAAANIYVFKNFGITFYGQRDLDSSDWIRRDIGVVYRDECTRIEVVYHREEGSVRLGGPSESIQLRLTLATLGEPGYRDDASW